MSKKFSSHACAVWHAEKEMARGMRVSIRTIREGRRLLFQVNSKKKV